MLSGFHPPSSKTLTSAASISPLRILFARLSEMVQFSCYRLLIPPTLKKKKKNGKPSSPRSYTDRVSELPSNLSSSMQIFTAKPKKRLYESEMLKRKKLRYRSEDGELLRLRNPMIGFGVLTEPSIRYRTLPEAAIGPPYFYYENVALAPKGVWDTNERFLYDVEPELVDSKYFCAAARKRGYVQNHPIGNRFPLLPLPPRTIREALPMTKRWWPSWDTRTKLNCIQTLGVRN